MLNSNLKWNLVNSILTPKGHLLVPPDKFEARSTICQIWKKKPYIALYMYILGPFFPKDLSSSIFQKSCPWFAVFTVISSLQIGDQKINMILFVKS